jgi:cold shock protein
MAPSGFGGVIHRTTSRSVTMGSLIQASRTFFNQTHLELNTVTIDTTKTYSGVVSWFGGNGKHYGFIEPDGGGPNVFVHISAVGHAGLKDIKQGDRLEYSIEVDERSGKPCAAGLKLI